MSVFQSVFGRFSSLTAASNYSNFLSSFSGDRLLEVHTNKGWKNCLEKFALLLGRRMVVNSRSCLCHERKRVWTRSPILSILQRYFSQLFNPWREGRPWYRCHELKICEASYLWTWRQQQPRGQNRGDHPWVPKETDIRSGAKHSIFLWRTGSKTWNDLCNPNGW
jgi:hypothetical protein